MTINRQWRVPVDPECEVVADYAETFGLDPLALVYGVCGQEWAAFERLHRGECQRCALYAAEHISTPQPLGFTVVS